MLVILALAILAFAYFCVATVVGVYTGWNPFDPSTPLGYRIFLWPCARVWLAVFPGIGGL